MKQARTWPKIQVSKKAEDSILAGHPWIYAGEIANVIDSYENGDLVDVLSNKGKYLGTGFINDHSKIRIRLISRNANDTFDQNFWKRRIEYAWNYRKTIMPNDLDACRIIFGEADFFPGLTVDKFHDILVVQTLSLGIEKRKDIIFPLLYQILTEDHQKISGIYERNDVKIRTLEGMEETTGWYPLKDIPTPTTTETKIIENGITYTVDFANGQKTGFFLDQKYNRLAVSKLVKDKTVLDCCTHTGSFALNAAMGQAKKVTAVDISETALLTAKENIKQNHFEDKIETKQADIFELLEALEKEHNHQYDFIILDPPAFTKSRETISNAMRGYKEINYRAMKLLPRGGYLVTASCSHFASDELFRKMLKSAAHDANVSLRQIEERRQSPDHPILWNVPETDYLKFYIFQVV